MTVLTRQQYIAQRMQLAVEIADMDCRCIGYAREHALRRAAETGRRNAERELAAAEQFREQVRSAAE